jgi:hypothetical protein
VNCRFHKSRVFPEQTRKYELITASFWNGFRDYPKPSGGRGCLPTGMMGPVGLTTHIPLVLTLRMSGAVPLLPLCAFMATTGRTLLSWRQVVNGAYFMPWIVVLYSNYYVSHIIVVTKDSQRKILVGNVHAFWRRSHKRHGNYVPGCILSLTPATWTRVWEWKYIAMYVFSRWSPSLLW